MGWINLNKSVCVNWTLNKFSDENSTLAPAEVKQDAAPKPSSDVTHILLCFEGARYAKKITFERICAAGEISAIERNRKVLLLELRWEEEEESRSLGQQVSEAQMTSQLYNLCSPAYKTAAPHFRELQQLVPARKCHWLMFISPRVTGLAPDFSSLVFLSSFCSLVLSLFVAVSFQGCRHTMIRFPPLNVYSPLFYKG